MAYPHQPENIKVCPDCGTNLIHTAKHCAVCGYRYADLDPAPAKTEGKEHRRARFMPITINLPILLGVIALLLIMNTLVVLGLQKRDETKALVAAGEATATYIATTYVSPTPLPTVTAPPPPPTETPIPKIEYQVVEGDSCLSIAKRFNLYLDSLLAKNDIDCASLTIGTVLNIPNPTATPESEDEEEATATP